MAPEQQHAGGTQEEAPPASITAQVADDSQASDNDGGERPVRNKLKETSITSVSKADDDAGPQEGETSRASSRGRKRSFDEDQPEKMDEDSGHRRKRSRDSNTEEDEESNVAAVDAPSQSTEDLSRKILSPKKKRSRDQLDKDEAKPAETTEPVDQSTTTEKEVATEKSAAEGEPEKKRHRDDSQEREKASIPSGFANTSAVSPFGVLGASKQESSDPSAVKSSSAFAASSMAAFAKSEQSPFGTLGGATSSSIFKSSTPSDSSKPAATGFAAAAGASGFASLGSGFAGFSGGFGSAAPAKSALTSFASPAVPSVLGSSKPSAFGQPEEEEAKEGEAEEADAGPGEFEQDKTDERFFERPIETGEENEKTYFSCKAKLFQFSNKEWKERGIGTFKVNVRLTDGVEDKKAARMIMRADGVLRVMLNTPIFKGMTVGDAKGQAPKSKQIHLASLEEGRSVPLLLRTGSEELANELYNVVKDLQSHQ
ncbi:hypothetical protein BO82DRAFT_407667 [Aspergillus uvarum CBS 121591]|uniref:RanBD1 domain-containing protein n=1 Tax=Aspergillus uvarum CBS 121591 TaxID=1448315 RepID=A0A319BWY6_9EURO|nr:hypothetical protein BO82DRAFT_407667 [Aspergillus uvarum CBS 121591]PYH75870.1 hypothetical protein BO82DRAFT_407667 [Aspergillus uvarum CBS 121591]